MSISASKFRHRITIQAKTLLQNMDTGDVQPVWVDFALRLPAGVDPLSAREFVASNAGQSQITSRMTIRKLYGLKPDMRILYGNMSYDPHGFLPDVDSGLEYITIPVSEIAVQIPFAYSVTVDAGAIQFAGSYLYGGLKAQGASTLQWYRANDVNGTGRVAIAGATGVTYALQVADQGKFLALQVVPVDVSQAGEPSRSLFVSSGI